MQSLLHTLDYQNFGAIALVLGLLYVMGCLAAQGNERALRWSLRAGGAALLAHAGLMWIDDPPTDAHDVVRILFRGLVTAALMTASGWTLFAFGLFIYERLAAEPWERMRQWIERRRQAGLAAEQSLLAERARLVAEEQRQCAAPERDRERQRTEERALQAQADQRRREAARLDCELHYAFHASEIARRFSATDFERFVRQYLSDAFPAAEVERRAGQLRETIARHVEQLQPRPKVRNLLELSAWHAARQTEAQGVADERLRRVLLAQLNERYSEMATALLEEASP
jgi:hypothetical protein